LKLRTFDGEPVRGKLTTDSPLSQDGLPVLLIDGQPFSPEEAEFFLESATQEEMEMLEEAGYDLPEWENRDEGYEEVEEIDSEGQ
jgi:hypothetical protein